MYCRTLHHPLFDEYYKTMNRVGFGHRLWIEFLKRTVFHHMNLLLLKTHYSENYLILFHYRIYKKEYYYCLEKYSITLDSLSRISLISNLSKSWSTYIEFMSFKFFIQVFGDSKCTLVILQLFWRKPWDFLRQLGSARFLGLNFWFGTFFRIEI